MVSGFVSKRKGVEKCHFFTNAIVIAIQETNAFFELFLLKRSKHDD